jgi:hypothetical protein
VGGGLRDSVTGTTSPGVLIAFLPDPRAEGVRR